MCLRRWAGRWQRSVRDLNRDVSAAKRAADTGPVIITHGGEPAYLPTSNIGACTPTAPTWGSAPDDRRRQRRRRHRFQAAAGRVLAPGPRIPMDLLDTNVLSEVRMSGFAGRIPADRCGGGAPSGGVTRP